ncbi:Tyr recombinase domain-containing protein [Deinococcus saxicola]
MFFATLIGDYVRPGVFSNWHDKLVREAGVPRIRLHDMRHTAASLMILRGIPPKTVSERLGHADVTFTLRTYTHLYDDQREETAFDLSDLFPQAAGMPN